MGSSLLPEPVIRPLFSDVRRFGDKRAVRDGNLKLLWDVELGTVSLFDLAVDPGEMTDLSLTLVDERARLEALLVVEFPEIVVP